MFHMKHYLKKDAEKRQKIFFKILTKYTQTSQTSYNKAQN